MSVILSDHKINSFNRERVQVEAIDEPGSGGAHHHYLITLKGDGEGVENISFELKFQNGPTKETPANGWTDEALLAVLIHRMKGFQAGPFPCYENEISLQHQQSALAWMLKRAVSRELRGVEGRDLI